MKHVMIVLIRAYQLLVSTWLPSRCIYSPTCSSFAIEAYRRYGFWRGSHMAITRMLRCWPWSAGGPDPVP